MRQLCPFPPRSAARLQVRRDLCSPRVLVMEWINGMRCTDPAGIRTSGIDVNEFIRNGVVSALRQLLEVRGARDPVCALCAGCFVPRWLFC